MGTKSSKLKGLNNRTDGRLLQYLRSTFLRGGGSNSGKRASEFIALTATGGNTVTTVGNYKTHIFTSPGTFSVDPAAPLGDFGGTIEYLVIAGGGGGGVQAFTGTGCPPGGTTNLGGGGGGAGGVRTNSPTFSPTVSSGAAFPVSTGGSYSITVGSGGAVQTQGNPSVFNTGGVEGTTKFTATGGGRGGDASNGGGTGGSGGGAGGGCRSGGAGNSPPTSPSQGNPGESSSQFSPVGGQGGSVLPGGGVTSSAFTGSSVVYARGGNGNSYGGVGQVPPGSYADGGGAYGNASGPQGTGANGVVIVRYQISA